MASEATAFTSVEELLGAEAQSDGPFNIMLVGAGTCSESEFLKHMNVNVKAVIEVGEGYARCKECFPEAKLFWDIRKTIRNFRACPQMVERLRLVGGSR